MKIRHLVFPSAICLAISLLTSCTLTVDPSGNRTYSVDAASAVKAIEILAQK